MIKQIKNIKQTMFEGFIKNIKQNFNLIDEQIQVVNTKERMTSEPEIFDQTQANLVPSNQRNMYIVCRDSLKTEKLHNFIKEFFSGYSYNDLAIHERKLHDLITFEFLLGDKLMTIETAHKCYCDEHPNEKRCGWQGGSLFRFRGGNMKNCPNIIPTPKGFKERTIPWVNKDK